MAISRSKLIFVALFFLCGMVFLFYNEFIVIELIFSNRPDSDEDPPCIVNFRATPVGFPEREPTAFPTVDPCDVVVMVLTGSTYHNTRLVDIQNTYMKHACQTDPRKNILFISDATNDTIPTMGVPCANGYDYSLCCKVINGWKKAFELYPKAKYYIQVDDDSYLVYKNLLRFLSRLNSEYPLYTGSPYYITLDESDGHLTNNGVTTRYTPRDLVYAAGWFGVITHAAMERVFQYQLDQIFIPICSRYFWPDIVVGLVLRSAGAPFYTPSLDFGYHMGWNWGGPPEQFAQFKNQTVAIHAAHNTTSLYDYQAFYYSNSSSTHGNSDSTHGNSSTTHGNSNSTHGNTQVNINNSNNTPENSNNTQISSSSNNTQVNSNNSQVNSNNTQVNNTNNTQINSNTQINNSTQVNGNSNNTHNTR